MSEIQTGEGRQPEDTDREATVIEWLEQDDYSDLAEAVSIYDQSTEVLLDQIATVATEGYSDEDEENMAYTVSAIGSAFEEIADAILIYEPYIENAARQIVALIISQEKDRVNLCGRLVPIQDFQATNPSDLLEEMVYTFENELSESHSSIARATLENLINFDLKLFLMCMRKKSTS